MTEPSAAWSPAFVEPTQRILRKLVEERIVWTPPGSTLEEACPALAVALALQREEAERGYTQMMQRLSEDRPLLAACLGVAAEDALVGAASLGECFGRCGSAKLTFTSGKRLVYKSRPMALDAFFRELLARIGLRGATILARGTYGWSEWIEPRPLDASDGATRFFRRAGAILALMRVLGGGDAHARNVIAAGDMPVLIDCEALIRPQSGVHTLLYSAMLPVHTEGVELSEQSAGLTGAYDNLPFGTDGTRFSGRDFVPEVIAGYRDTASQLSDVFAGKAFDGIPFRVILRSQKTYRVLLAHFLAYGPNGALLRRAAPALPETVLDAEGRFLLEGMFPRFYAVLGERALYAAGGRIEPSPKLPACDGVSIAQGIRDAVRIATNPDDMELQASIIRALGRS